MSFQYINPTEEQKVQMQTFRDIYQSLADQIKQEVSASRGVSLALTNLEQSAFWLNKAITKNDN